MLDAGKYRQSNENGELSSVRDEIDTLLEKIVELRARENALIIQNLPQISGINLRFDETTRTIFWLGGVCILTKKEFLFLKTLWEGMDRYADLSEIEETVWAERFQDESFANFVPKNTIKVFLLRLREKLKSAHFPYAVITNLEVHGNISGFFLKITRNYRKT